MARIQPPAKTKNWGDAFFSFCRHRSFADSLLDFAERRYFGSFN
jgi:hypothetical protein